jgi:hypothetical protein
MPALHFSIGQSRWDVATYFSQRAKSLNKTIPGNLNLHQKACTRALPHPFLSAAISNMVDENQVKENLAVARGSG